jgi:hypothetical protein
MSTTSADGPFSVGRDVYAADGAKLGVITKVYPPAGASDESWVAVDAGVADGPFLVPSDGAATSSEGLQVPHTVDAVHASPHITIGDDLTDGDVAALSEYYGVTARTSLVPDAARVDGTPVTHGAADAGSAESGSAEAGSGLADGEPRSADGPDHGRESTHTVDGHQEPGTVTISGADGDVEIDESDALRAARAAARAAAGYDDDSETIG